ncbi:MAG: DUF1987 domain-containing protein [Bacteroidales bacterium]|jgi:hypothetical protein|nr:DUF1987 domain-containing protein [Bacteroidales bacterium]
MQKLHIEQTLTSPEIYLSPEENKFYIRGTSAPEDVRALYYPVIEWIRIFIDDILEGEFKKFTDENPVRLQIDLSYFNSSSAKFLFDILNEFKRLLSSGTPVLVEWNYEEGDPDMEDAGNDISLLVGMEFSYIAKQKG